MTDPKKRLRNTLTEFCPISYRIKELEPSKEYMDKKIFIEVIEKIRAIEDRKDFMETEIGLDMTMYEDMFFNVIENLFKLAFNKEQIALIQMYLYQITPDNDWDGTITIEVGRNETTVNFKTPEDLWNVIKSF